MEEINTEKYADAWKEYYDNLVYPKEKYIRPASVPRHIIKARRAANYRARASRRVNRLMAKGKHL